MTRENWFLFDNNLPPRLARALLILGKSVTHVGEVAELGRSAPDDLILTFAAQRGYFLVSQDRRITRTLHFQELIAQKRLGAFFVFTGKAKQMTGWEVAQLLVKAWDQIEAFANDNQLPFSALVQRNGRVVSYKNAR